MTDEQLVRGFEAGTLDEFPHAAHVRVAWWYLTHDSLLIAMARFRSALQRFAAAKAKPNRYHETITIALLLIIAERLEGSRELPWDAFAARNPDLLQWPSALSRFYTNDVLSSPRARDAFVLPEAAGSPI